MGTPGTIVRLLATALPLLAVSAARADPLDGDLEIRSAYAVSNHGVIMLSARVAYPGGELLSASLKDGVTLSFDLECTVTHHRRLWFDTEAVSLVRHSELSYQVVTDRYLLHDLSRDEDWQIGLRAGVRRGHMPDALRALMFWSDAWHRTSDWYTWTLVR